MKIQYFGSDLSYALDIGEIADMHVETLESGVQVLRIECSEKAKDEYKTIRVKSPKTKAKTVNVTRGPARPMRIDSDHPQTIADKLLKTGADWMKRNKKPEFMRDAGF